ncbi:DUF4293 domain-containing protein [Membranihabitans maritimus]|uniref:DUF4293 domain-containing protein n=1 Tax=Membranihabitans maritimus TaxID=2904244 RepID=UPI001F2687F1|nr:DUF4293 domain-containing protein [Membranihabitans maritimus]
MIQRKQSIYLLLASILFACLFFQPVDLLTINGEGINKSPLLLFGDTVFDIYDNTTFIVLAGTIAAIILITIFLYNNRKLQINLSKISIALIIAFIAIAIYFTFNDLSSIESNYTINPRIGAFLPFASILLLFFAIRGIRKDDKLVKSMDRLR